jgi:hypothetical protein
MFSQDKTKMDNIVRWRKLPYVRGSRRLYRGRVVRGAVPMPMERKKKVMRKQRRSLEKVDEEN